MSVPTDRRAAVRVQLRLGMPIAGVRQVAGYQVMILGAAKPSDWPECRPGDLEGLCWTTPRQVQQVRRNLEGQPGVIATRGDGDRP